MGRLYVGDDTLALGYDDDDDDDDDMGLDEILGDEDDDALAEIFGADSDEMGGKRRRPRRRGRANKRLRMARLAALARAAGGAVTKNRKRVDVREQPLPIPPTSFTTGQQQDIELRPQRLFRTERLVVSSVIAPYFRVLDVKIGQETQFVASGALPATIFSEVAVGVRLKGDTANLGNTIVVSLQNIDTSTRTFSGAIIGTVVM